MVTLTVDELTDALVESLPEWRRHTAACMDRATCKAEHGALVDFLLEELAAVGRPPQTALETP